MAVIQRAPLEAGQPKTEPRCSVCVDKKRRPAIDAMLAGGAQLVDVGARFGLNVPSLHRHRKNHLGRPIGSAKTPPPPPGGEVSLQVPPTNAEPVAPKIRLDDPADVLFEFGRLYERAIATEAAATANGDVRLALQAQAAARDALDKVAKARGLYSDGVQVNVDNSTRKLELAFEGMTPDEIRAWLNKPPAEAMAFLPPGVVTEEVGS